MIKAQAAITLASIRDVLAVVRFYMTQASATEAPAKPTVYPAPARWSTTEPGYTEDTKLYTVDCTVFSDGTWIYSEVSLNSSYEAGKVAVEKVIEAGGVLAGGHSIADDGVKYGLSVTGLVHPSRMYPNNQGRPGDALILTKPLGVGIICTASRVHQASPEALDAAIASMTTLNKTASELCRDFPVHACTDITGFGFLGHLHEMMDGRLSCRIAADRVPVFPQALDYADEFLLTAAGQRNRNHMGDSVRFDGVSFAMEEVLFDPQTSGGLLIALPKQDAPALEEALRNAGLSAAIVGEILEKTGTEILVTKEKEMPL